jgi:hypothetical protein
MDGMDVLVSHRGVVAWVIMFTAEPAPRVVERNTLPEVFQPDYGDDVKLAVRLLLWFSF